MWGRILDALGGGTAAYALASPSRGQGGEPSFLISVAPFFIVFAIIYFVMIRPQMKRQQEQRAMLSALKPGDNVIAGGIYGEIARIKDDIVYLKVADNVRIRVHRSSISTKLSLETGDSGKKEKEKEKEGKS